MPTPTGLDAAPTLDGHHLAGLNPQSVREEPRRHAEILELATGRRRETIHYRDPEENGAPHPDVQITHTWRLSFAHVRQHTSLLDALKSRPGQE